MGGGRGLNASWLSPETGSSSVAKGLSLTHSEAAVSSPAVATACPLPTGLTEGEALGASPRPPRWSADGNTMLGKGPARGLPSVCLHSAD